TAGIHTDYTSIAPRFGFSASLPRNFVFRGGFGLSFFPINYQSGYNLKNAPANYQFTCALQQFNQSQSSCAGTPYASTGVAQYGVVPNSGSGAASPVGQTGGWAFDSGLPVPFLNVNQVFAPTAAQCVYNGSLAGYNGASPTTGSCPLATDPYQSF